MVLFCYLDFGIYGCIVFLFVLFFEEKLRSVWVGKERASGRTWGGEYEIF